MASQRLSFLVLLLTSIASPALAGGIAGIGVAKVNKGQFTAHLRNSFGTDNDRKNQDNRWRTRLMTDYGFTDWFASGIYFQGDQRDDKNMELDAVIWENRFEFTDTATDGYYSGIRLRYTYRDGDKKPDQAHIRFIAGAPLGNWEFRANPIIYKELGEDARSGLGLDARFQVTYGYMEGHRVGIENFSDVGIMSNMPRFDKQSHTLGPVFTGKITPSLTYETGYAYGLSQTAPDHTLKLFLVNTF
jgi:hypothetical protein